MIEALRELFAKLYAAGCEHDNYAYALSDELNAEVDKAMLKAFKNDLENLVSRCELVSKTEKYALDQMKGRIPARPFIWYKLHRVPNEAAKKVNEVLSKGDRAYMKGAVAQIAQIEWEIRLAQSGVLMPEGESPEDDGAEAAETSQNALQDGEEAENAEEPEAGADTAEKSESAAELWDEEEADEDDLPGDAE